MQTMIRGLVLAGVAVTLLTAAPAGDAGEGAGYEGEVNETGLPHGGVKTWEDQFGEFIDYYCRRSRKDKRTWWDEQFDEFISYYMLARISHQGVE